MTDSFSTQLVSINSLSLWKEQFQPDASKGEVSHRNPKTSFTCTSKQNYVKQLAQIERRQMRIHRIQQRLQRSQVSNGFLANTSDSINTGSTLLADHYKIGKSQNHPVDLTEFLRNNAGDPAIQVCHFLHHLSAIQWQNSRTSYLVSRHTCCHMFRSAYTLINNLNYQNPTPRFWKFLETQVQNAS